MSSEVALDLSPLIKVYHDGRIERVTGTDTVPPSLDPNTGIQSNDIVISPETGLSARLYLPTKNTTPQNLPLLVYFHGGGFVIESAASPTYHHYLNALAAQANVVVLSVDYRLAPEHPLPTAYDDSWSALQWLASSDSDPWLTPRADRRRVYLAGDSAGANIAHHMALRFGIEGSLGGGVELKGIVLVHPFFWGSGPTGSEADVHAAYAAALWRLTYPGTSGLDDPLIDPKKDPNLKRLGCGRVLVCVAEKDILRDRGLYYVEVLRKSGWEGDVVVVETKGEEHVFHLFNLGSDKAGELMNTICGFFNNNQDV